MKNVEDIYPLSPMQQGILFHTLYAPDAEIYIEQLGCTFHGPLDTDAFRQAWQKVIDRNPALRTCFVWEGMDEPLQVVKKRVKLPWQMFDWRDRSPAEQKRQLEDFLRADRRRSYDLADAPLLRLSLMQIDAESFYFIFSHHHLILDGWSVPLVLRELFGFYEAMRSGEELNVEVGRPFSDYIAWLQKQDQSRAENYWRETLEGFTTPVSLTPGREQPEHAQPEAVQNEQRLDLAEDTTTALNGLARRHELTLSTIVQGAWAIMLSRYSGETDIVFGAAVAGRPADLAGVETMIGLFINTLPVRVKVRADERLLAWLKSLQAQLVELRQYEYSPLVDVQSWSELGRGRSLFESLLVFENFPVNSAVQEQKGTLRVEDARWEEASHYPLSMVVVPGRELQLRMEYNTNLFDAPTIGRMIAHFGELLKEIAAYPEKRLEELSLLLPAERQRMLYEWNEPQIDYPAGRCLHELFEAQAEQRPEAVAVKFGDEQLTYDELNGRANRLARQLQSCGVEPETLVGIFVERSLEMTVGVLGILKAGGAYVPLDPEYPPARLSLILEDAGIELIVAQAHLPDALPAHAARIVRLEKISETSNEPLEANLAGHVHPDNLAYVIYTSGSTGRPKGALITHRAVVHHDYAIAPRYDLSANDRVLQFASLSFDVAVEEMFPTWLHGGCVVLRTDDALSSPLAFYKFLSAEHITVVNLPTAFWNEVMNEVARAGFAGELALRVAAIGGERGLHEQFALAQRVVGSGVRLMNVYGPTETTVTNTAYHFDASSGERQGIASVPLGRPIGNTPIYIFDEHVRPVPVGVTGEMYIGGDSVARGYLNRPELTAEKFIPNPFSREPGARIYRTGDRALFHADGNIEFMGRVDHQVKVRGFRIELGEVEAVLAGHQSLSETFVMVREDGAGDQQLVAYVVSHDGSEPAVEELRGYMGARVPDYMVPQAFVVLSEMPLTSNGKIDKNALPSLDQQRPHLSTGYVAPRTPLEQTLVEIWSSVLRVESIGIDDNFFDLGGHSLLATQVVSRTRELLHVELPLRELFESPTVAELAPVVDQLRAQALEQPGRPVAPITRLARGEDEELLRTLDQMSEAEVNLLLQEMAAEGSTHE